MSEDFSNLITLPQAAQELGYSETRLRRLFSQGRGGQKIGGSWLITRAKLNELRQELAKDPRSPLHKAKA